MIEVDAAVPTCAQCGDPFEVDRDWIQNELDAFNDRAALGLLVRWARAGIGERSVSMDRDYLAVLRAAHEIEEGDKMQCIACLTKGDHGHTCADPSTWKGRGTPGECAECDRIRALRLGGGA